MALKYIGRFIVALLVAVSAVISSAQPIFALNGEADYDFFENSNLRLYDPNDIECGGSSAGTVLRGADNTEKIWNWLRGTNLSPEQTAGIMGNMQAESGLNPFRLQGNSTAADVFTYDGNIPGYAKHAWGLVQWDGPRRIDKSGTRGVLGKLRTDNPTYVQYIDPKYGSTPDAYKGAPAEINDAFILFELNYMIAEASPGGNRSTVIADLKKTTTVLDATVLFHNKFEGSADSAATVKNGRGALAQAIFDKMDSQTSSSGDCSSGPGGDLVYYSQHDPKWASVPYAHNTTIGYGGCGPTSMAMILATLVDKSITPIDVAANAGQQNGGTFSHRNLINGVQAKWPVTIVNLNLDTAIQFLKDKKGYIWVGGKSARGPNELFTSLGHMVAFVGVTADGKITAADPHNPPHQQIRDWDKSYLAVHASSFYGVSAIQSNSPGAP